jgi:hypothetical protein
MDGTQVSTAELSKRLVAVETAVAHLTEALEELAKVIEPGATPSASLVASHLRDIRENFNQVARRRAPG